MNRSQKIRLGRACVRVRSGDYEGALPALEALAQETEAAHAMLAEIYGFLFEWDKTLEHAVIFLGNPLATGPDNVFIDMVELTGRAARETRDWPKLIALCEAAQDKLESWQANLQQQQRYAFIVDNLKRYAEREGAAPHELVRIFGYRDDFDAMSQQQKRRAFEQAIEATDTLQPRLRDRPAERLRHQISLALVYRQWEAATVFYENNERPLYDFAYMVPLIKHAISTGEETRARQMLERHLPHWIPLGRTQIAPVILLTDKDLQTIADTEMCRQILQTSHTAR